MIEQQSADTATHATGENGNLVKIGLSINVAERSKSNRYVLVVDCHIRKPLFNSTGPPGLLGCNERMILFELEFNTCFGIELTRLIVDRHKVLQLIRAGLT